MHPVPHLPPTHPPKRGQQRKPSAGQPHGGLLIPLVCCKKQELPSKVLLLLVAPGLGPGRGVASSLTRDCHLFLHCCSLLNAILALYFWELAFFFPSSLALSALPARTHARSHSSLLPPAPAPSAPRRARPLAPSPPAALPPRSRGIFPRKPSFKAERDHVR